VCFSSTDVGIDLGTATVLIYVKNRGIVLHEPSIAVVDVNTNEVVAIGEQALDMLGKTPGSLTVIRPLRDGVISDYDITEKMLRYFMGKVLGNRRFKRPRVMVCVPSGVTDVERRAVGEAAHSLGAREVNIIEEPLAAAIGAGLDVSRAHGAMVVDIGGGTTDIAVVSLKDIVVSHSIKMAGNKMDEAIIRFMKKKYNMLIGEKTAEMIKINVGSVYEMETPLSMEVMGRNLLSGLPSSATVTSDDVREALVEVTAAILEGVHKVLEKTPPELAADIYEAGIVLTGGGAQLLGLDRLIATDTMVSCRVADDPVSCVAIGTGKCLDGMERIKLV
jgi:rod shape-determining protein MreB